MAVPLVRVDEPIVDVGSRPSSLIPPIALPMHLPLNCSVMERFPMLLKGGCGAALGLSSPSALACPFESANTNGRGLVRVSTEVVRGGMVAVRTGKQRPLVDVQRMPL